MITATFVRLADLSLSAFAAQHTVSYVIGGKEA